MEFLHSISLEDMVRTTSSNLTNFLVVFSVHLFALDRQPAHFSVMSSSRLVYNMSTQAQEIRPVQMQQSIDKASFRTAAGSGGGRSPWQFPVSPARSAIIDWIDRTTLARPPHLISPRSPVTYSYSD